MKTQYNKSEIMKAAWSMFRSTVISFADALRKAWTNAKCATIDFSMNAMSENTTPAVVKTEQQQYDDYIAGRIGWYKRNGMF